MYDRLKFKFYLGPKHKIRKNMKANTDNQLNTFIDFIPFFKSFQKN